MDDEEVESCIPGLVELPSKVKQISAGDSHTVALTEEGRVFYWGTFRDSSGSFGLTPDGQIRKLPVPLGRDDTRIKNFLAYCVKNTILNSKWDCRKSHCTFLHSFLS